MRSNWPTKKLEEVLVVNDTGIWGKPPQNGKEGFFVIRSTNFNNDGSLSFRDIAMRHIPKDKIEKLKLETGDILLEKSGGGPDQPVGRVVYFKAQNNAIYTFANFIQRLRSAEDVLNSRFLFYFLLYLYKIGITQKFQSQTTGIRNLNLNLYFNTKIPLPPLRVQYQIVERLDAIKKAQELNDKQIALADELFQSLLHRELDPKGKNWKMKRLGDLCDRVQQTHPKNVFKEKFRYIDIESINPKTNKIIGVKSIEIGNAPSRARKPVTEGDTVFATTRPYLKNIAYVSPEFDNCIASTGFCVIRPKRDLLQPKFLFFMSLSEPFISKVLIYQRGASYPAVPDSNIYNIKIPLPPFSTQHQIVERLQAVQDYKKKLLEQKQKLQELFESCLDKAMKGELVR